MTITTVGDLVAALAGYPPETAVRLAVEPGYPQAATIGAVACSPDDADLTGRDPTGFDRLVWIAEGTPIGYYRRSPAMPSPDAGQRKPRGTTRPVLLILVDDLSDVRVGLLLPAPAKPRRCPAGQESRSVAH